MLGCQIYSSVFYTRRQYILHESTYNREKLTLSGTHRDKATGQFYHLQYTEKHISTEP